MKRSVFRRVAVLVAVCTCALVGVAAGPPPLPRQQANQQPQSQQPQQAQSQQPQQPTFRAGVNLVRVDVIVTDKRGDHVTDLKASDFEVWEDGRPQRVDSFRLVRIADEPQPVEPTKEIRNLNDEESEISREGSRLIALMLDDYHVRPEAAMRIRSSLRHFVESLGPSDLVAVMYPLMPVSALRWTRDHASLGAVIDKFEGRAGIYNVRNEAEGNYAGAPPEIVEAIRTQVSLSALRGLAVHMGGLREGRKSIVLVSEGFFLLPAEMRDLEFVYSDANRSNAAIYTVDPGGLSISGNTWMKDSLRILSDNTDGRAIVNRNDVQSALQVVVRDSSSYYLIGYNSDLAAPDGKFHEIKVRVKRPGVEVRGRKGYWAPTAEEAAKAAAPSRPEPPAAVTNALAALSAPAGGRLIRTWIGTVRGDNGKTRLTFAWRPAPMPADASSSARPARVSLTATGEGGATYFSGTSPPGDTGARPATARGPGSGLANAPARMVFDAPPGKLQLKVSVESNGGELLESDVRDFVVPDYAQAPVVLATPAVYLARTARDYRAIVADPMAAVPSPDRQFTRTDRVVVVVEAYGPAPTIQPLVKARLLNRNGQEMSVLPVSIAEGRPFQHLVDLPVVGLAAGEYMVEFSAQGAKEPQVVAFRIGS